MDQAGSAFLFQLVSSSLSIEDGCVVFDQIAVLDGFISTVNIKNFTLRNCVFNGNAIQITGTTFSFEDVVLTELRTSNYKTAIIHGSLESIISLSNVLYKDSDAPLFIFQSSTSVVDHLRIENVDTQGGLTRIEQDVSTILSNWYAETTDCYEFGAHYFTNSQNILLIENITMIDYDESK